MYRIQIYIMVLHQVSNFDILFEFLGLISGVIFYFFYYFFYFFHNLNKSYDSISWLNIIWIFC